MNAWLHLAVAIFFEIAATTLLKMSEGFSRPLFAVASVALYAVCFWGLSLALRDIPMGIAYGIWSGVGIAGATLIGWALFGQNLSVLQVFLIAVLSAAAIGLAAVTASSPKSAEAVMVPVPPNVEPAATALAHEAEVLIQEAEAIVTAFTHHEASGPPPSAKSAPAKVEQAPAATAAVEDAIEPTGAKPAAGIAEPDAADDRSASARVKPPEA